MTQWVRDGATRIALIVMSIACGYLVVTSLNFATGIAGILMLVGLGLFVQPRDLVFLAAILAPVRNLDSFVARVTPGSLSMADVVLVAFVISAWMRPAKGERSLRRYMPFVVLGCIVLVVAIVSMLNSGYMSEGLRRIGRMALAGACVLGAARSLDWGDAKRTVLGFVYSTTAVALAGMVTTVSGILLGRATWSNADSLPRLWAGLVDPNHFGVMVAMALVITAVWPGDPMQGRLWRLVRPALTIALIMTLSRGALLSALGGLVMVGVLSSVCRARGIRMSLGRGPLAIGVLAATVAASVQVVAPRVLDLLLLRYSGMLSPESDGSASLRLRIQAAAESLLADNALLGVGPGAVSISMVEQGLFDRAWEVHSSFVELAVELGYAGFVPYVLLLVGSLLWFVSVIVGTESLGESERLRIAGLGGAVVAGIFGALTLSGVLFSAHFVILSMLLAVGCSMGSHSDQSVTSHG